jgi:hypothetical protein
MDFWKLVYFGGDILAVELKASHFLGTLPLEPHLQSKYIFIFAILLILFNNKNCVHL